MDKNKFFKLSDGSEKLKRTENVRFLIWNIPARITCPYATDRCKKSCYAFKSERYTSCKNSRYNKFLASQETDFVDRMINTIEWKMSCRSYKGKKIIFRIHESGDFYNEAYADKWIKIARHFEGRDIVFMAYTKSVRFFIGKDIPENMTLRFSVWDDTREEEKAIAQNLNLPIYTAHERTILDNLLTAGYTECLCSDCGNCGKCWSKKEKAIAVEIH